jgi:hypothetical protein
LPVTAKLYAGVELERVRPAPLPIENILLNLRIKVQRCFSSPEPKFGFAIS